MARRSGATFGLTADVSKAHRRFKHAARDHGLLGCVLEDEPDNVLINLVGTFGMGSASYWWGREFGFIARCATSVLMDHPLRQLIFADDANWLAKGAEGMRAVAVAVFIMAALGTPISWPKMAGGFS